MSAPRRILYIVNPISGTKNKKPLKDIIRRQTAQAGYEFEIADAVGGGDYRFLIPYIQQKQITDIVIAGGDGTVNGVVGSLHSLQLPFGIIPCGSGNGLALSAGISKNYTKALHTVFHGRPIAVDSFLVNNQFACMLCGVGFDAQVAHDFANHTKRGMMAYIKKIVQNFFSAPVYPFTLLIGGQSIVIDAFFISIANSNQFGNNFTIAPKASLHDGLLDIVVVMRQHKLSLLLQTIKQVRGLNKLQQIDQIRLDASILYFRTKELSLINLNKAPLHIDGEPVDSAADIVITVKEKTFQLICP